MKIKIEITQGQYAFLQRKAAELRRTPALVKETSDPDISLVLQGLIDFYQGLDTGKSPLTSSHKDSDRKVGD